jgi:TRAP-type C4-dicarboxylate transport system permease small subunit
MKTMRNKKGESHAVMKVMAIVSRIMIIAAVLSLLAMIAMTVADVFLRHLFKTPVPDSQELTEYLIVCVAFLGMAWVAVEREHVTVDLIVSRFSPRTQAIFDSITYFLVLGVFALMTWRTLVEAPIVKMLGGGTSLLDFPAYPFFFVIAFGLGILCLVILIQLIQNIKRAVTR